MESVRSVMVQYVALGRARHVIAVRRAVAVPSDVAMLHRWLRVER